MNSNVNLNALDIECALVKLEQEANSDYLHNASNLCGIVNSFSRVMKELNAIARAKGQGTAWVNTHKVTRLWICKLSDLSGYDYMTELEKSKLFA